MPNPKQIQKASEIKNPEVKRKYLKAINLPDKLYNVFWGEGLTNIIGEIREKYKLTSAQTWQFSYRVGMILLGEQKINDFVAFLEKTCGLDRNTALAVAEEVNRKIFLPVQEDLKKIHGIAQWPQRFGEGGPPPAAPPPQPAVPPQAPPPAPEASLPKNVVNLKEEFKT